MNKKSILLILLIFPLFVFSQEKKEKPQPVSQDKKEAPAAVSQEKKESPVQVKLGGFVRVDYHYDSRQAAEAVDGLLLTYPLDNKYDSFGNDINSKSKTNGSAIFSRLYTKITAPDVFKAKTTGHIEFDFTARTTADYGSTATVRFRQAWIKLDWEKTSIQLGQDWHPLCVKEMFPSVAGVNTGVPFQPFNRSPQLTLRYNLNKNLSLLGSALMQTDYTNYGPSGNDDGKIVRSHIFQRYAQTPNLHIQLRVNSDNILAGIAYDYKQIQPQIVTRKSASTLGTTTVTDEKVNSYAMMAFLRYKNDILEIKGKAILGQNLTEQLLPGGYAVSTIDSLNAGIETYTPSNNLYLWGNILYGKKFQIGLFGGYYKNNGYNDNLNTKILYGRAENIASIYRLAPCLNYKEGNLLLNLEWEYTSAAYGTIDFNDKGKVIETHDVDVNRIQFTATLFF